MGMYYTLFFYFVKIESLMNNQFRQDSNVGRLDP